MATHRAAGQFSSPTLAPSRHLLPLGLLLTPMHAVPSENSVLAMLAMQRLSFGRRVSTVGLQSVLDNAGHRKEIQLDTVRYRPQRGTT